MRDTATNPHRRNEGQTNRAVGLRRGVMHAWRYINSILTIVIVTTTSQYLLFDAHVWAEQSTSQTSDAMQTLVVPQLRTDIRTEKETSPSDLIFRLPHTEPLADGTVRLSPWLQVVGADGTVVDDSSDASSSGDLVEIDPPLETEPPLAGANTSSTQFWTSGLGGAWSPQPRRLTGGRLASLLERRTKRGGWFNYFASSPRSNELGLGYERLGTGAFQMDNAEPYNHFGVRLESAVRYRTPDIAEYFFAKTPDGRGPENPLFPGQAEASVNYTDFILTTETGGPKMSLVTQLPIRFLDPVINANTAGLSDMSVATKLVMLSGDDWRLTQLFRTYINTGAVSHGLGTGHVSMEPGFAFAWRPRTRIALHGELKYWFPIAGDPFHSGQILRYGIGGNRVFYENDHFAILQSLEFVAFTVQDGRKTARDEVTGLPIVTDLDGDTIVNIYPGVWFVSESKSKFDLGISSGYRLTGDQLYDQLLRIDLRFGF